MNSAVLVIDVQQGLCEGEGAAWDCPGTLARINCVTAHARSIDMPVIFVQHESGPGYLEHGSDAWQLARGLDLDPSDLRVRKATPDAFLRTGLQALLEARAVRRLIICGMHSEFCIDSTTRAALALGYEVDLVSDAHTSAGNAVLSPQQVIAHHNETLTQISSFGARARATTSAALVGTGARLRSLYDDAGGVAAIFSAKVADYVAARPDYPRRLFDTLATDCGIGPGSTVADVAAGTGLLTRGLLELGCKVIAIEPNEPMRQAADHFLAANARYRSIAGSAERLPLPDDSIDLVSVAHAFHWFEVEATRAEFLRVLRPGGQVALIWNDRNADDPLHRALDRILDAYGGEKRAALAAHEARGDLDGFFGRAVPAMHSWLHEHRLDVAGLESLVFSRSYMPARESDEGRRAIRELAELHARRAIDGRLVVRYTTVAWIGRPA